MDLKFKKCTNCDERSLPLTINDEEEMLPNLTGWDIIREDVHTLSKTAETKTFRDAVELLRKIADIAESENHHPDLHLYYNKLNIQLHTHKVGGLTENDFIVAAKIDELLKAD